MNTLFFDTETTGLTRNSKPCIHPDQPMPVQLGMKLDAANRRETGAFNVLIKTNGLWKMDPKAKETTGLNEELADEFGTDLITAVELFLDYIDAVDTVVAHNINFDITVMRRAARVYSEWTEQDYFDPFEGKTLICTMFGSQNIVKAHPKRNGEWKWPRLEECVKFFWNEDLDGAHDALVDVRACARVYYHLRDQGHLS